jgi:FkbM family methyltransferase
VRLANDYISEIEELLSEPLNSVYERERSTFDKLLADCGGRLVLFGAGNLGRKALKSLRTVGLEPLAFADNGQSKWGSVVDGIPVLSPGDAAARYGASALFVVTIWSPGNFYQDIRKELLELGCHSVAPTISLTWKFAEEFLPDLCLDLPHKVYEEADWLLKAACLWDDDCSRREYLCQLRWRVLGCQDALQPPVSDESYFLDSVYDSPNDEVFIDCGAYDGDTARQLIRRNPNFSRVVAIEADPTNFDALKRWLGTLDKKTSRRIDAMNVAVGAKRGRLCFQASADESSRVAVDGNLQVDCIPLDELLKEIIPTTIKMDVEGAEPDVLEGARHKIETNRPILCICAYHRQNDLWRIPLLIESLAQDYRLFLRPHDADGRQLVCYAVPLERLRCMA